MFSFVFFFFFNDTATTEIYTLSLHDALPICRMIYANQRARRVVDSLGDQTFLRGGALRERLVSLGGRPRPLKQGAAGLGGAILLPPRDHAAAPAERQRLAILHTLEQAPRHLARNAP